MFVGIHLLSRLGSVFVLQVCRVVHKQASLLADLKANCPSQLARYFESNKSTS